MGPAGRRKRKGVRNMRWGKIAVLLFTGVVGLGLGFVAAQPWDNPTEVDALELDDEARREEDAFNAEVRDDDDDDDRNGTRRGSGGTSATDDGGPGTTSADGAGGGATSATDDGGPGTTSADGAGGGGAISVATDTGGGGVGGGGGTSFSGGGTT
jgi:hypothetical protein